MTPEELDEMARLEREATSGPWQARFLYRTFQAGRRDSELSCESPPSQDWPDCEFIAASRSFVPKALAEIARVGLQDEYISFLKNELEVCRADRDKLRQDMHLAVSDAGKGLIAERDRYREAIEDIAAYQTVGKGAVTTEIIERAREALEPSP